GHCASSAIYPPASRLRSCCCPACRCRTDRGGGAVTAETEKRISIQETLRRHRLAGTVSVIAGLVLWEVVSRVIVANPLFLAAPTQIAAAILALGASGELWRHIGVSAIEFALGYAIACVLGILAGLAMANSAVAKRAMQPWVSGLYATPT